MLTPAEGLQYSHPVFTDRIIRLDLPAHTSNFETLDLLFPGLYNPMWSVLTEMKDSVLVGAFK